MKIPQILTALWLLCALLFSVAVQAEIKKESPDIVIKLRKTGETTTLSQLDSKQLSANKHIGEKEYQQIFQAEKKRRIALSKQQQQALAAERQKELDHEKALEEQDKIYAAKLEKEMAETQVLTALDLFNHTMPITFRSASFGVSKQQERTFILKYFVDNKGGKPLQLAKWTAVLKNADNVIFTYDVSAPFEKEFMPETRKEVIVTLKLKELPDEVQKLLSDPNAKISVVNIARELVFNDDTKIQVN
ncbi:hypothetical protein C8D76_101238 [Pasteurella langaaensis DSM 22999]|uniref:Uncharacterized protein n=1 Tax=Alitibacter langaaensis DSM 22999 TaxID=1122935 RepID=A0A2U0TH12_9PAST|nr:hypothetical protein [Pasteurella langaaensis]PVX42905.1 hypothetical protein C8D76_101238 [Pasteurella langaaensis DSM 22999]